MPAWNMTKYVLFAAIAAFLAMGSALALVKGRLDDSIAQVASLEAELSTAKVRIAQAVEAAAIHKKHVAEAEARATKAEAAEAAALNGVGSDETLPDYLRDLLDGLRP